MPPKEPLDLRELLIDAHAHFFFLKGVEAVRLKVWQILSNSIVIETPSGAPLKKTVLGYLPTIDGAGVYEIEGALNSELLPDQMPGTVRIEVSPSGIRRVNRRLYPRYNFTPPLEAKATPDGAKRPISVGIINLSAGGLRIESSTQLSPKSQYTFSFKIELEDETHELNLKGNILYELPSGKGFAYGIRFGGEAGVDPAPVEALEQTVDLLGLVNRLIVTES